MKLSKVDLSSIVAISHDDDCLGLVIDRGADLEFVEVPAPLAAYEGLRLLDAIVSSDAAPAADFNQLPGVNQALPMLPVQSSMANAVGYDPDQHLLQVQFKNGAVYQYEGVDVETWHELQDTDSPGRFFNREIKGSYRSRRLNS
ncbi:KTSC domain-containing protein [Cyanobacteria bacterium FACHB-DQ100]|nr:KTSC domain-containing protein [Cyanobacteria bacterium FACHB-DQ100]